MIKKPLEASRETASERGLGNLMNALAENCLTLSEEEVMEDTRLGGEEPASRVLHMKALLWSTVKSHRQRHLQQAMAEYHIAVQSMRRRDYHLPEKLDDKRELLSSLFQRYPQMQTAFLTVQHREFKSLSDQDVDSFLKQLDALGALKDLGDKNDEDKH